MRMEIGTILSILYSGLYLVLAGMFAALAFLAFREEVPPYARDPPCFLPLRKMAVYLCRKILEYRGKRRKKGKDLLIPGEEGVRSDFAVLYPAMKARRREVIYRIVKTERILLLTFAGIVLAGVLHAGALGSGILQEDGRIEREPAGGEERTISLTARLSPETGAEAGSSMERAKTGEDAETEEAGKKFGTYRVTVQPRQLTKKEAEAAAGQVLQKFPECLLGENPDPDNIRYPLKMPDASEILPFSAEWESSSYSVLDTDGSIFNSDYAEEQREEAELTLILTYADYRFEKKMSFAVRGPVRDETSKLHEAVETALRGAEKKSATEPDFALPAEAGGKRLVWEEKIEDMSPGVLLGGLLLCLLAWYMMDQRLHEKIRERNRQLAIDYPQLISKIVLYLGAGMSVRNVFYQCAGEYRRKKEDKKGNKGRRKGGTRYLYEEIQLVCNELDSGIHEAEAYMHFGRRCRSRQYTKLCTLLVQNLRRGNDELLAILQEEARCSFEERKNLAREMGEEAGTKLLLPMMIMLGVTMLIIIVPAYFSFAM